MLFHISKDILFKPKKFTPRIPRLRIQNEDYITKRVCVSNSIRNALNSFPYKNYIMMEKNRNAPVFLSVYVINEELFLKEDLKTPIEIIEHVPDAIRYQEHWIMKPFIAKSEIVRIKKIYYSDYSEFRDRYSGVVTEFLYEKEIEAYAREEKATFYNQSLYKLFKKRSHELGIIIKEELVTNEHIHYFGNITSSKTYEVHRVIYQIPAGISARNIWEVIHKELAKNKKKNIQYAIHDYK